MMPWKLRKRQKKFTCQSKSFISMFSFAKFKLVSCNLWQMTYTQSQTAKTVLATLNWSKVRPSRPFGFSLAWLLAFYEVVCVGCRSRSWFVLYAPGAREKPLKRATNVVSVQRARGFPRDEMIDSYRITTFIEELFTILIEKKGAN